jgi:IclR family transcriptional regulator, acetate operon repressor
LLVREYPEIIEVGGLLSMKSVTEARYLSDIVPDGRGKDLPDRPQNGRTIQSVERALTLLEIVADDPQDLSLSELAERSGLNVSTCHHLAATLVARGYLTQLGRNRGYTLGTRIRDLHEMSSGERDPAVLLRDPLAALGLHLGHGVQMAVMSENSLITKLSFPDPNGQLQEPDEIEKISASHATATGKAILAWIPDTELARVISANGLTAYTEHTITSLSGLVEELRLVRRRKFAIDDEEFCKGIVCIGASLRNGAGAVVGAISISFPKSADTEEHRKMLTREMIAAGHEFSRKLETK